MRNHMEYQQIEPVSSHPAALELDDVDALIEQLETQFEASRIPMPEMAPTNGCTVAAGCTGSCPCGE